MKDQPLRTTVIGSYPFPGWLEFACQNLQKFGEADREEMIDDAVIAAIHDQTKAGLDVITDGEQTRLDFNLSFYGYLEGIELESQSPRQFGPPAHDQRGKHKISSTIKATKGLGTVDDFNRLKRLNNSNSILKASVPGPYTLAGRLLTNQDHPDRLSITEKLIPIVCKELLSKFLPTHFHSDKANKHAINSVSAAPYGSSSILLISWTYIAMLNTKGLTEATKVAILNANYMAEKLSPYFDILFREKNGYNAHEFIIDIRPIKKEYNISEEDVAKRLMDYGYHAPTMSWPVPGTMMIEPTESESKNELDKFCNALISIKKEISDSANTTDTPLKNAPHTALEIASENWSNSYTRELAAYPTKHQKEHKYWPPVGRIDNAYGDRNLVCTCPSVDDYKK